MRAPPGPAPAGRPPVADRPWSAEVTWATSDGLGWFRVLARDGDGSAPQVVLESARIDWPPATDTAVAGLRDLVGELDAAMVAAGWRPIEPGAAWYARRFAWAGTRTARRRWAVALAALVAGAAVAVAVALALDRPGATEPSRPAPPAPTRVAVGGRPVDLVVTPGALWVADAAGRVLALDRTTGTPLRAPIATPYRPGALAVGPDAVWLTDATRGVLVPIRFADWQVLAPIPVGAGTRDVAISPGAAWTVAPRRAVVRYLAWDRPATATLPVGPAPVAVAADGRWVVVAGAHAVTRIDAATFQRVGRPLRRAWRPAAVALDGDRAWVLDGRDGAVAQLHLTRGTVVARSRPLGPGAAALAVDGRDVAVLDPRTGRLVVLDRATLTVRWRRAVPRGAAAVGIDAGTVWVADTAHGALLRFAR